MNTLARSFVRYALIAPFAAVLLVSACSSRINAENFGKIQNGMTRDEVHDLLGKPDETSGGGIGNLTLISETWRGHKQTIHVSFGNDKVVIKTIEG